jgi:hypothetical protein
MNTTLTLTTPASLLESVVNRRLLRRPRLPAAVEQDEVVLIGMVVVGRRTADGIEIDAAEFQFLEESELLARFSRRS